MKNISKNEFRDILKRYRERRCTPAEENFVEEWYSLVHKQPDVENMSLTEEIQLKDKMWKSIVGQVPNVGPNKAPVRKWIHSFAPRYSMAVAAALVLLIIFVGFFINQSGFNIANPVIVKAVTGEGQKEVINLDLEPKEVVLPDGSHIILQQNSKVIFSEAFDDEQRKVFFVGEAFFEIAKDPHRPFFVYTNNVVTKVLGTSFLIKAFQEDMEILVMVKTGKVSVYTKDEDEDEQVAENETILTPNQQAVYNKPRNTLSRMLVDEPEPIVSKEKLQLLNFENAPIADIFHSLEDVYQIQIEFDEKLFSECKLTTSISGGGIFNRLDIICTAIRATYKVEDTRVVIEGTGCGQ